MTLRPPFFVPRPDEDNIWQAAPVQSIQALLGTTPFTLRHKPRKWRLDYTDDEPFWSSREKPNNNKFWLLNSVNPLPIRRMPWQYKQDDEPYWEPKPRPLTAAQVQALTVNLPVKWRWPADDEPFWQGHPVTTNINTFPTTKPKSPAPWRFFDTDDEPFWQAKPVGSMQPLVNSTNPLPIRYVKWRFQQDDEPFWEPRPRPLTTALLNAATVHLPAKPRFEADDEAFWLARPVSTNPNTFPSVKPKTPVQWRFFDTDDEPFWQAKPVGSIQPLINSTNPLPIRYVKWRFPVDDEPFWQGQPIGTNPNTFPSVSYNLPGVPAKYRFEADDEQLWQGRPVPSSINLTAISFVPVRHKPRKWDWENYDDPEHWQRTIYRNIAISTSTVPAIYNVSWKHWDDPSDWQWKQPYNQALIITFTTGLRITDTTRLQLPINAILMGQQDYEVGPTEIENNDPNYKIKVKVSFGGGGKLSSSDPGFTTKTSKKGYD